MLIEIPQVFLRLLTQFTGERGGIDNNIVFYGISALLFLVLFAIARAEYKNNKHLREKQGARNTVRISVTDHGNGIPAEFGARIFQKFAQADSTSSRQKSGTGLGLAITRELVERMGGEIGYDSVPNQGCCFFVDFELAEQCLEPI